jgi:hypothetical protein
MSLPQLKDGQLDVNAVMNIAKPILENIEKEGRNVDEAVLRSDIANCTVTSKYWADRPNRAAEYTVQQVAVYIG